MSMTTQEMGLYYGGNTYACGYEIVTNYSKTYMEQQLNNYLNHKPICGQIVPPSGLVERMLRNQAGLYACIRTKEMSLTCISVEKLYTPGPLTRYPIAIIAIVGLMVIAVLVVKRAIKR